MMWQFVFWTSVIALAVLTYKLGQWQERKLKKWHLLDKRDSRKIVNESVGIEKGCFVDFKV